MKLRKVLMIFLVGMLLLSVFPFSAYSKEEEFGTEDVVYTEEDEMTSESLHPIQSFDNEETHICRATVDDHFDDGRVIVTLKHKYSVQPNEYLEKELKRLNTQGITDLTSYYTSRVEKEHSSVIKAVNKDFNEANLTRKKEDLILDKMNEKFSFFHRILCLSLSTKGKENVLDTIKELEKREDVLSASPNYYIKSCSSNVVPNDTQYNPDWAINHTNLEQAWNVSTGSSSTLVGVLDSGIYGNHPDLIGNLNTTLSQSFGTTSSPLIDSENHGTNVAGIIGAKGNNNKGIAGVCWNVSLVSLKHNHNSSDMVNAINYAEQHNIQIMNLSAGFSEFDYAVQTAINNYSGLIICAAGNDGANIDTTTSSSVKKYPSLFTNTNIISVTGYYYNGGNSESLYPDSNYGATSVDLAAPILGFKTTDNTGGYETMSFLRAGTSFSTPFVTGVAALIKSKYPTITYKGIRKAILGTVTTKASWQNKIKTKGYLNANAAIRSVPNQKFTVKYNLNGGQGSSLADTTVTYGIPKALRKCESSGFRGWYAQRVSDNKWLYNDQKWYLEGNQPSGCSKYLYSNEAIIAHSSTVVDDTIKMYAQWKTYEVKFEANGGGGYMPPQTVIYGQYVPLTNNSFVKAGYIFNGWYAYRYSDQKWFCTTGTQSAWLRENEISNGFYKYLYPNGAHVGKSSSVNNDVVKFYAQWQPYTYTVTYNLDGGAGTIYDTYGETGTNSVVSSNVPTKSGFTFLGWRIVDEDGFWSTTSSNDVWLSNIPHGYRKKLYQAEDNLNYLAESECILTATALWKRNWHVIGDIDRDGIIGSSDVRLLQNYLAQNAQFDDEQEYLADINQDGMLNATDETLLMNLM